MTLLKYKLVNFALDPASCALALFENLVLFEIRNVVEGKLCSTKAAVVDHFNQLFALSI
jgi:hypothetical protein